MLHQPKSLARGQASDIAIKVRQQITPKIIIYKHIYTQGKEGKGPGSTAAPVVHHLHRHTTLHRAHILALKSIRRGRVQATLPSKEVVPSSYILTRSRGMDATVFSRLSRRTVTVGVTVGVCVFYMCLCVCGLDCAAGP